MCCCISSQLKNGHKRPLCDICSLFRAGPGSKRLGIDGDREAIPLTLQIAYSKVSAQDWHKDKWGRKPLQCWANISLCWGLREANADSLLEDPESKPRQAKLRLIVYLLANWGWHSTPVQPSKIGNVQSVSID